jgi:hypothetical protein
MERLKEQLVQKAIRLHGQISPAGRKASLEDCFTFEDSRVVFWFNDRSGNTRALVQEREG